MTDPRATPDAVRPSDAITARVIAVLLVTLLATLHPASSAARLYPIEAIRSE